MSIHEKFGQAVATNNHGPFTKINHILTYSVKIPPFLCTMNKE